MPNQIVGEILWQMAATARGELPSGLALHLEPKEWLEVVKFLYAQIDGPPKDGPSGDKDDPFHFKLYEGIDPDQL